MVNRYRGHQFVEINYRTPSNCDVCKKPLPWAINLIKKGEVSYECKREALNRVTFMLQQLKMHVQI